MSRSIVSRSAIASSGNGDSSGDVDGLQVAAAAAADLDAAILPLFVGRGGDERFAVLAAIDARVGRQLPGAARRTSSAACGGRQRLRPWPATSRRRDSSRAPARPARRAADRRCAGGAERAARCRACDERADGQLGHEPDEIGRQAAMHRAGSDRRLVASAATRSAASRLRCCRSRSPSRMCSRASPAPPAASASHSCEQRRRQDGTGSGIGSPASAGTPRASLAARYFGGSDSRGRRPPSSAAAEVDDQRRAAGAGARQRRARDRAGCRRHGASTARSAECQPGCSREMAGPARRKAWSS